MPAAEGEPGQRGADVDTAGQQLRLKERRFFEEVFQHDVDAYLSSAHQAIREHRRRESARMLLVITAVWRSIRTPFE